MLTLVVNMRPRTRQLQIIGQELALEMCNYSFLPVVAEHVPGVANKLADELSRRQQPGCITRPLPALKHAREIRVPIRTRSYDATLGLPELAG